MPTAAKYGGPSRDCGPLNLVANFIARQTSEWVVFLKCICCCSDVYYFRCTDRAYSQLTYCYSSNELDDFAGNFFTVKIEAQDFRHMVFGDRE